ncbi:MAG TPA: hypothetical protein VKT28_04885 [Puia sp.]|nr:hypothetical protein [Puia sp.]
MKKMSLANAKQLSRAEMKHVRGGLTAPNCNTISGSCAHSSDWTIYICGISQSDAKSIASGGGLWCTSSCQSSCINAITYYT